MSTKYEIIELDHTQVTIDVSLLKKDQLYFNATEIAKQFGKIPHDFLKLDSTAEYIQLLVDDESVPISNRIDIKLSWRCSKLNSNRKNSKLSKFLHNSSDVL